MEPQRVEPFIKIYHILMTIIYFDDNNYPHYKAHIEFLSRRKGNEVCNAVEFCKGPPLKLDEIGRSIGELNICPKLLLLLYIYIYNRI